MPSAVKDAMLRTSLGTLGAQLGEAAAEGGFDRPEARLSRQRLRLDQRGWRELAAELEACTKRIEALEGASEARLAQAGSAAVPAPASSESPAVVMMLFVSSPRRPGRPEPSASRNPCLDLSTRRPLVRPLGTGPLPDKEAP